MPLPAAWVESLFTRLAVRYGSEWTRRWEGIDIAAVKADWAEELSGFINSPDAIKHGLENLPADRPPTVSQFRVICRGRPDIFPPQIKGPASSDEVVNSAIKKALAGEKNNEGPRAWANRLRIREQQAERLSQAQRDMWRAALTPAGQTEVAA
jgi:hypothetical protein